jgi:hypothetical protein
MLHGTSVWAEQQAQDETNKTHSNDPGATVATYQNAIYGVSIKYPSNWAVQKGINSPNDTSIDVADFSPPISSDPNAVANFAIIVENLQPSDTRNLDLVLRNTINGYRVNSRFQTKTAILIMMVYLREKITVLRLLIKIKKIPIATGSVMLVIRMVTE